jgi:molecular chaperone DnaK (HSP70)
MIERPEFEALCQKLMPRLNATIQQCLNDAGVKKEELHAIEVVGGGVRVPIVGQK